MADSGSNGITHAMAVSLAVYTAGGTGNIIFGGIRKEGQFSNKDMFSVIFKAITFSIKYMEALAKEVVVEACPVLMIYQIRAALFIKRQMPHNACKGH